MEKTGRILATMERIKEVVGLYRGRLRIQPVPQRCVFELSCVGQGEVANLFRQLALTDERTGEDWEFLSRFWEDDDFRERVLLYIRYIRSEIS